MRELLNYAKAWAVITLTLRAVAVIVLIIAAIVLFVDGGTLTVSWQPGGLHG